jgi:hypothetical protein
MSPSLPVPVILAAISAAFKFGRVAVDAYEQHARDQKILIPHSPDADITDFKGKARKLFMDEYKNEVTPPRPLAEHWDSERGSWKKDPESRAAIFQRAKEILAKDTGQKYSDRARSELDDYLALKQWGENEGPLPPMARVGLALVDTVANFVSAHPEAIGIGNNSARFASALARNISALLPEYEKAEPLTAEEWARVDFTDQAILIALRAGLNATRETVDVYLKEEHLQKLVLNVTEPLVDAFSSGTLRGYDWRQVRDNLLDPMMQAAVGTIAAHQKAFLGEDFDPDEAVGAVTKTLLEEIAATENGLLSMIGEEGAIRLYRAALSVVAQRPDLFLGGTDNAKKVAQALIGNAAKVLRNADPVWRGELKDLGRELLLTSIETIDANKALLFSEDDPWEQLAGKLFTQIAEGMKQGAGGPLENLFNRPADQILLQAIRALLEQVATSPEMITGSKVREDVRKIVAAVAAAMAKDDHLLLTAEDWPEIVAVVAYEASRNPGRLFKIDTSDPLNELGTKLISRILATAAEGYQELDSEKHKFLAFGETLRNAIITTLQHAAGNAKAAFTNLEALETLTKNLNQVVAERPDELGAAEWQSLFRRFVTVAIDTGRVDAFSVEKLNQIINQGVRT